MDELLNGQRDQQMDGWTKRILELRAHNLKLAFLIKWKH